MKNVLVQYQGGGYSGCFWEWNFFFLDGDGNFHDIYSSGRNGIVTMDQAQALLDGTDGKGLADTHYVYDLLDVAAIEEFSKESNACNVAMVLKWFVDNPQEGIEFFVLCSDCEGRIIDYEDICLEDWHGCGGIASSADNLICSHCQAQSICCCCGENVGKDGFNYERDTNDCNEGMLRQLAEFDENNGPLCQWCWEAHRDELIKEERDDLAWRSFAFGEPDRFSEAMRWFWGFA